MRIGFFNVKYSSNLGDGLLSECLESSLSQAFPGMSAISLDLAGRQSYGPRGRFRGAALTMLECSPQFARQGLVATVLKRSLRSRIRPRWREALRGLDAIVVGGGNLFGDADLNFPLKIDAALDEARDADLPVAVYGVGVSDDWSPRGEELFRHGLSTSDLIYASVRDKDSQAIWTRRLGPSAIRSPFIAHDPGLLVSDHIGRPNDPGAVRPLVGIGVASPTLLRYHADEASLSAVDLTGWLTALAVSCVQQGWRVALFSNGSAEDDDYLRRIGPSIAAQAPARTVTCVPRFLHPWSLARFIGSLDLCMAHRLHASVAAYSYAIPHIGFTWDRKLRSFFTRMGREAFVCTAGATHPSEVISLAQRAMQTGIDPIAHQVILRQARADVALLGRSLQDAIANRPIARAAVGA